MADDARPEEKAVQKHGGAFTAPENVNLHANDFEWSDKMAGLSPVEKEQVDQYLEICTAALTNREPAKCAKCIPQEPWEGHYKASRHHFPLKNYVIHAFPVLKKLLHGEVDSPAILECGCGSGSALLPLVRFATAKAPLFVGFDVSATSIRYFAEHEVAKEIAKDERLFLFTFDAADQEHADNQPAKRVRAENITTDVTLKNKIACEFPVLSGVKYDAVLLVFVLSALPSVEDMRIALKQLRTVLKPDGVLCFRDYAVPDMNFFRFLARDNQVMPLTMLFRKSDETTQVFFEREFVLKLFAQCGFVECDAEDEKAQYHCNRLVNRRNDKMMDKIFINGTFRLAPE